MSAAGERRQSEGRRVMVIGPTGSGKSNLIAALGAHDLLGATRMVEPTTDETRKLFQSARTALVNGRRFVDQATSHVRRFDFRLGGAHVSCIDSPGGSVFGSADAKLVQEAMQRANEASALVLCIDLSDQAGLRSLFIDLQTLDEKLRDSKRFGRFAVVFTKADEYFKSSDNPKQAAGNADAMAEAPRWLLSHLNGLMGRSDECSFYFASAYGFDMLGRPNVNDRGGVSDGEGWEPFQILEPLQWVAAPSAAELAAERAAQKAAKARAEEAARLERERKQQQQEESRMAAAEAARVANEKEKAQREAKQARERAEEETRRQREAAARWEAQRAEETRARITAVVVVLVLLLGAIGGGYFLYQKFRDRRLGEDCSPSRSCAPGLECAMNGSYGSAACGRPYAASCAGSSECAGSLTCRNSQCRRSAQPKGKACYDAAECSLGLKCLDHECAGPTECRKDSDCSASDKCEGNECQPRRKPAGGRCTADSGCEAALVCRAGSCRKRLSSAGETCSVDSDCGPGLLCSGSSCQAPPEPKHAGPGEVCESDGDCSGKRCFEGFCGDRLAKMNSKCSIKCPIGEAPRFHSWKDDSCRLFPGDVVVAWDPVTTSRGDWYNVVAISTCKGTRGYLHEDVMK